MITLDIYLDFYKKNGRTIDQIQVPIKSLSEDQLIKKFNRFKDKEEIKFNKNLNKTYKGTLYDTKWVEIRNQAFLINPNAEHFFSCLTKREEKYIKNRMVGVFGILDPAHILGKKNDKLYYNVDNILICPRYFHSCIDHYINPWTMKTISYKERITILKRFVNKELWEKLELLTKDS